MISIDATSIDKSLPVPVGTQLHGLLTYMLTYSDIPIGTKLPSVRQMAADIGIAPMTVQHVYKQLRDVGLIEMRQGLGAFTAVDRLSPNIGSSSLSRLHDDIAALIDKAAAMGLSTMDLVSMVSAHAQMPRAAVGLDIAFVIIFEGPAQDYVAQIQPLLQDGDTIRLVTLDDLRNSEAVRQSCRRADLIITFANREAEVRPLVEPEPVLGLRFIPAEKTRQALAGLDPRARVAAVTHFKEYIAIMRPSVREFAPHVSDITVTWSTAPDLEQTLARCDAVIYASGADHVAERAPAGTPCFEFRHAPDPAALDAVLAPRLAASRIALAEKQRASHQSAPRDKTREAAIQTS